MAKRLTPKIELISDDYVIFGGRSDAAPYKRRRKVFNNVTIGDCRAYAQGLGLVAKSTNMGDNLIYLPRGVSLKEPTCHLHTYISWAGHDTGNLSGMPSPSVMEIWYEPEVVSQEEADAYYDTRAVNPTGNNVSRDTHMETL